MKIFPLLLACLAVSMPHARAQEAPSPAKTLATIDPQARDLLARLDARYKKFRTFQALVELRASEPVPWKYARYRVALDGRYRGAVTMAAEGQGTQKTVFDGKTVLATDSKFPRRFTTAKLDAERYSLRVFLRQSGAEGITVGLLTDDNLASVFLDPDLQSIEMGPSETVNGTVLQNVVLKSEGKQGKGSLTLLIDPQNLILRRATTTDTTPAIDNKTFVFTETYSEIKFDETLPPALFSTLAPPGFRVIDSFATDTGASTVAPIAP